MSTPPQLPAPATIRRPGGGLPIPKNLAWLLIFALILVIAISLGTHHESRQERLVTRIVTAVQNNDMAPVASDFDAQARESMTREKVGHLSDLLAPMGKIKNVEETTGKNAGALHTYVVHFEKGDWSVEMPLDIDGKAKGFYMRRMAEK
ncbi:MAG: hypothetical protein JO349_10320 [Candidatus Eremiobacteraeota bacterium]|nr:hypothetical protein [Candidatus Eremiobacteraeota bacterium]